MKTIQSWVFAAAAFLLLCPSLNAGTLQVSGYLKNFSVFFSMPELLVGEDGSSSAGRGDVTNRFRMRVSAELWDDVEFSLAYDLSPRVQDPALFQETLFFPGTVSPGYRVADFRDRIYPSPGKPAGSFGLFHNLDRLVMMKRFRRADLYVGRQAVAWGSARIINPTDIIAPFSFNQLDTEDRRGVDAVRLRIPLGMMDELDLGVVAGEDFKMETSAAFLRWKFYVLKTDISLLSLAFRRHLMMGFNLARALGGAGVWYEAALVFPQVFKKDPVMEEGRYFRMSAGLDYNFTSRLYGFAEYHFSSAGSNQPETYFNLFSSSAFQDGAVYLLGKHYIGAGATYQVTPLLPASVLLLCNAGDPSLIVAPQLEYNIAPDIYLSAGAYLGFGSGAAPAAATEQRETVMMQSEFGSYPDMVFTSFRIYF